MRIPSWIRQHLAAARALLVLTVVLGVAYPLAVWAVAQIPGLRANAEGSYVSRDGHRVGSSLIGQSFTDKQGDPLKQYFQSRPSAAGDGYDPTATSASNLGPESIVDTLPDPKLKTDDNAKPSLLTTICSRSKAIGELDGVDGGRPFCTRDSGVGAVLAVFGDRDRQGRVPHPTRVVSVNEQAGVVKAPFLPTYEGVKVELAKYGEDYSKGLIVPVKGDAPAKPAVPADAVTASGSGLDPDISPAYADIQVKRVAAARHISADQVRKLLDENRMGRGLGFLGEPRVNVLRLNLALDRQYPVKA
ncbi:potassium-transporting ATPase subunit C [Actinomadura rupiterrae]|uniref:potassium-transporting ATPase subunit C n=1 Tax=Actinomadura rupiterrae TaxID=559627 RepID=UPI0020A5A7BF|nr:potassium-transporting ATPase subunit C [Actinomadura rupiterrae]MCP2335855.1 K+-transporting ATPase ATPase C chain [Actinomadura rupiterrae]